MKFFLKYFAIATMLCLTVNTTSFSQTAVHEFTAVKNIEWAKPKGFSLKMDVYTPKTGKSSYPILVIYHGGGWIVSPKEIMDDMSEYVASHSEYVVCNVQYRLLGDNENTTTITEAIEDCFGALAWIKEHAKEYKGNPDKVAVTGDSAGGHLAEMVVLSGDKLSSKSFADNTLGFNPTYLPKGTTAEKLAAKKGLKVQAAIISYGVFDLYERGLSGTMESSANKLWSYAKATPRSIFGGTINAKDNPGFYKAVSPALIYTQASRQKLPPQLFTVGTQDKLQVSVKKYYEDLKAAGQPVEYWEHEGRPHGYLDRGTNKGAGTSFVKDGAPAVDVIIAFLNKTLG